MNNIGAIFYDLDNTLYKQIDDIKQRIEYCLKTFSFADAEIIKTFWINEWLEDGPKKHNLIDKIINKFSLKINKEMLISAYRTCQTNLSLKKQTYEFLTRMKNKRIKQFLVTNGYPETQLNKIAALKLKDLFNEIIVATGEYAKPSSYFVIKLLEKYNLDPMRCLSVGDWYAVDGIASIGAKMKFIHMKGGPIKENLPQDVISIDKITDLCEYL